MTRAERIYRRLLRLWPRDFAGEHGEEAVDLFRQQHADVSGYGIVSFWARTVVDVLETAVAARWETRRTPGLTAGLAGWLSGILLDMRLGMRMLARSWGLTLAGVMGMSLAIALGTVFRSASAVVDTPLPLEEGARIVALESWDRELSNQERRILYDFGVWRDGQITLTDLSAYRTVGRNLILEGGGADLVAVAEMTAAGFRVSRVPALLGRTLRADDERQGAEPVVVIGYDVWQARFAGDADIVGRVVRLSGTSHTVVGVMPPGFAFPLNHSWWVPLKLTEPVVPRDGPGVRVFGRLAPGATLAQAQAELDAVGHRLATSHPVTHAQLQPRVMPYTAQLFDDMEGWEIPALHVILALLLVVISANIGVLVYARTTTRMPEIAVRSALGASRHRIIGQLFMEALVLALVGAAVGLLVAQLAIAHLNELLNGWGGPSGPGGLPFWVELRMTAGTVAYALGLTLLAALVVGVAPALRVAGGHVSPALRQLGGATGLQLGRTWTTLIVVQVAITVACLPLAASAGWKSMVHATAVPGFDAAAYIGGHVVLDATLDAASSGLPRPERPAGATGSDRFTAVRGALARAIEAEPDVRSITFAADLPGQEPQVVVEAGGAAHAVRFNRVDPGYFAAFDQPVLAGRGLRSDDLGVAGNVVVSRSYVDAVAGPAAPPTAVLGQQLRYVAGYRSGGVVRMPAGVDMTQTYQIVGVVPDFPNRIDPDEVTARVYHVLHDELAASAALVLRAGGVAPDAVAARLRRIAHDVDPALQLRDLRALDAVLRESQSAVRAIAAAITLVMLSVLLLSAAGISALMSFTVARRRREIGIRAALGARPGHVLAGIFRRALRQLAGGAAAGLLLAGAVEVASGGTLLDGRAFVLLPLAATLMLAVGVLATVAPARRGLRVQPVEALRAE